MQQAFLRHIAELEREAIVIDSENEDIAERLTNLDVQSHERESAIRNHLKNLQVFIKQQIAEKQEVREKEKKERRTRIFKEPAPVLNTDGGVADSLGVPGGDLALKAVLATTDGAPSHHRKCTAASLIVGTLHSPEFHRRAPVRTVSVYPTDATPRHSACPRRRSQGGMLFLHVLDNIVLSQI